jgi:hypothetical protein
VEVRVLSPAPPAPTRIRAVRVAVSGSLSGTRGGTSNGSDEPPIE